MTKSFLKNKSRKMWKYFQWIKICISTTLYTVRIHLQFSCTNTMYILLTVLNLKSYVILKTYSVFLYALNKI